MKNILSVIFFYSIYFTCLGQKKSNEYTVYLEKINSSFKFKQKGDTFSYDEICINKDTCFVFAKIVVLDKFGSYKLKCFDSTGSYIQYNYKGKKNYYITANKAIVDSTGKLIKTIKEKVFIPKLQSIEKSKGDKKIISLISMLLMKQPTCWRSLITKRFALPWGDI